MSKAKKAEADSPSLVEPDRRVRVLLVSKNPALALALATEFDVATASRDTPDEQILDSDDRADVIVVDLPDSDQALRWLTAAASTRHAGSVPAGLVLTPLAALSIDEDLLPKAVVRMSGQSTRSYLREAIHEALAISQVRYRSPQEAYAKSIHRAPAPPTTKMPPDQVEDPATPKPESRMPAGTWAMMNDAERPDATTDAALTACRSTAPSSSRVADGARPAESRRLPADDPSPPAPATTSSDLSAGSDGSGASVAGPSAASRFTVSSAPTDATDGEWTPPLLSRMLEESAHRRRREASQATPSSGFAEGAAPAGALSPRPGDPKSRMRELGGGTRRRRGQRHLRPVDSATTPGAEPPGVVAEAAQAIGGGSSSAGRPPDLQARTSPPSIQAPPQPAPPLGDLIEQLISRTADVMPVRLLADVIGEDIAVNAAAEAVAVLIQAGEDFITIGGAALRAVERRGRISRDHWLVAAVVRREQALVVENTEMVRRQLQGAPLASREHVMALPIAGVAGLVIAARSEDAFDEHSIHVALGTANQAGPHLVASIRARELARLLAPLVDEADGLPLESMLGPLPAGRL